MGYARFWDMHSGGGCKEPPYEMIIIEADSQKQAEIIFYNRFGHNHNRITCTCCGEDYAVDFEEDIAQLTGYHRKCKSVYYDTKGRPASSYKRGYTSKYEDTKGSIPLEKYLDRKDVLFIPADDITEEQKVGELPTQGYVWVD